eukprot:CAMPEP_0206326004 /NCGR_PEP_ID=MMETSP0106_2-20121207/21377_1 /ASSEMBLY_ACC=CAM_ASM_000206 /TAXON_ID=81532 /ORGANISM="Acanthoeca-like sp., Strain 10tr" /LENGTH=80 /DNA_ID=CAMNT_0053758513 /DNA_START=396 /DNA_END=638 /DNA_ORIENTATION=+
MKARYGFSMLPSASTHVPIHGAGKAGDSSGSHGRPCVTAGPASPLAAVVLPLFLLSPPPATRAATSLAFSARSLFAQLRQ